MHIYAKKAQIRGEKSQDFVKISRRLVEKSQGFFSTRSRFLKKWVDLGGFSSASLRF
jgi:hypothetical protein